MKKYIAITILALTVILSSCNSGADPVVSLCMEYNETKCSDPWETGEGSTSTEVETAVLDYFMDLNISILSYESEIEEAIAEDCEACNCLTGRVIRVQVEDNFQTQLEEEGFTVQ